MEENQQQLKLYGFFQTFIYIFIFVDTYVHLFSFGYNGNPILARLNEKLYHIPVLTDAALGHITVFTLIVVISLAAKARKNVNFSVYRHFVYPFLAGLILFVASAYIFSQKQWESALPHSLSADGWAGASCYILGAFLLQISFSNLTKHFKNTLKKTCGMWKKRALCKTPNS